MHPSATDLQQRQDQAETVQFAQGQHIHVHAVVTGRSTELIGSQQVLLREGPWEPRHIYRVHRRTVPAGVGFKRTIVTLS
jgi:hypothetical protein